MATFEPLPVEVEGRTTSALVPAGKYVISEAYITIGKLDQDTFWSPWVDQGLSSDLPVFAGSWDGLAAVGFRAPEVRQPFSDSFFTAINGLVAAVSLDLLTTNGYEVGPVEDDEVSIGHGYFPVVDFSSPTFVSLTSLGRGRTQIRLGELVVEGKE